MSETSRTPIELGLFTIPQDPAASPRLLGTRCRGCGERFHPRRPVCAACLGRDLEDVELGPGGRIHAFTQVSWPLRPSKRDRAAGYFVVQVDLEDGPRVQGVLAPDAGEPQIGMRVLLGLETVRDADDGAQTLSVHFRAAGSTS
jgi:uncharacterized OB-fold protein